MHRSKPLGGARLSVLAAARAWSTPTGTTTTATTRHAFKKNVWAVLRGTGQREKLTGFAASSAVQMHEKGRIGSHSQWLVVVWYFQGDEDNWQGELCSRSPTVN